MGIPRRVGSVERDGERLHWEVVGAGDHVPIVLSHGAGGNAAVWFQQVAHLAGRGRRVVTWDHRGYGRSTDHAGLTGPEVAAGDLLAICDHLGIERADLVGQSMGGWTTVGAALDRPTLARRIVLADTLGGMTTPEARAALTAADRPPMPSGDELGAHPALGAAFSAASPPLAHLYQQLGAMGSARPEVVLPRLIACELPVERFAALGVPVLFVVGSDDPLFPPPAVRALAAAVPGARVVELAGCGHSPYFEDPSAFNRAVDAFLGP